MLGPEYSLRRPGSRNASSKPWATRALSAGVAASGGAATILNRFRTTAGEARGTSGCCASGSLSTRCTHTSISASSSACLARLCSLRYLGPVPQSKGPHTAVMCSTSMARSSPVAAIQLPAPGCTGREWPGEHIWPPGQPGVRALHHLCMSRITTRSRLCNQDRSPGPLKEKFGRKRHFGQWKMSARRRRRRVMVYTVGRLLNLIELI